MNLHSLELESLAEKKAEMAEKLNAFSGVKLIHIKREIAKILNMIGRDGIFDEYTKHDISHINYMLYSLEWIIPQDTQKNMTSSDWLMITLSIYFHDLGMLVTKEEFKNRSKTDFINYKEDVLNGSNGPEYLNKINSLEEGETRDRFLYQELVRKTHAERVKYWILDEPHPSFNFQLDIVKEIRGLLSNIDTMFRRDLALICESHHLSDLDDFDKYKVNQQYGSTKDEIVNLHYTAIILRTVDLLHITSDRTPSIEFNLINPNDPLSQREWAKQKSVKTVRPKQKKNKDGEIDDTIQKDTIEIIAYFENEKGFFGLISYINYVKQELEQSFKLTERANKALNSKFIFPWRDVDDTAIETKDFEKKQFEFVLDQTKILDLLVGHTLYNDATVVLRELIQNGIDAVRLKDFDHKKSESRSKYNPEITIDWNSKNRQLVFSDNGTGMDLEIIQNHLLKVGSSRYQDENFKKKYPDFSPISRFGIGLLTCFLISDDVDILTKEESSEKAILLKIRKVHGKYLLKYLSANEIPEDIKRHGTSIKLFVRSNIDMENIQQNIKRWILFPDCEINLIVDEQKPLPIGYKDPKSYIESHLEESGFNVDGKKIKVKQEKKEGITIAYALEYLEHYKEWSFLPFREYEDRNSVFPIGTCIEGIRIDFNTPGFKGQKLYSVVNTSGENAPKTNVARSTIEATQQRYRLLNSVYNLYLNHITEEIKNLQEKGFSISWAADEVNYLLGVFSDHSRYGNNQDDLEDNSAFNEAINIHPFILIERNNKRELISLENLKKLNHFWIIDSKSYRSADSLVKELKSSNLSALSLIKTIFGEENSKTQHISTLLCNEDDYSPMQKILKGDFQVDKIKIIDEQRRLDLRWTKKNEKIWEEIDLIGDEFSRRNSKCYIQVKDIEVEGEMEQIAIYSTDSLFILKGSRLNLYLVELLEKFDLNIREDKIAISRIIQIFNSFFHRQRKDPREINEILNDVIDRNTRTGVRNLNEIIWKKVNREHLIDIIQQTNFIKYDNSIWYRRFNPNMF